MLSFFLRDRDARLVRAALAGRSAAFERLVQRYLPMVHALACAHAGDADAEDVAQEAFLLAYHKLNTLREPRKFAGWLATITRNVARRAAQKRAREVPLEDAAAAEQTVDPAVEQRELAALLREHLDRMEDEQREVLLLYYFAGRTLPEIARILDISQDAAAKRLQRARQALGEQLLGEVAKADLPRPDFDGRRRVIMAAIVAAPAAWQAAAATAAVSISAKLLVGAAVVSATAVGTVFGPALWKEHAPQPVSSEPSAAVTESARADAEDASGRPETATDAEQPLDTRTGPGIVRGRVVDAAGNPVAGVQGFVELVDWDPPEPPPAKPFRRYGETDADGYAELRDLPLGPYGIIVWKGSQADAAMFFLSERYPVEEESLVLKPTLPLSGRVLDPNGAPVTGACVFPHRYMLAPDEQLPHEMTYPARQQTDTEGRFSFPHLPPGSMQFLVEAAGFPATVSPYIVSGASDAVITLAHGGRVEGRVVREDTGAAVPNVAIHWCADTERRRTFRVEADAEGRFLTDPLAPVAHTVTIDDPALVPVDPEFAITPAAGKTLKADIPVRLGAMVFGKVTIRETGEPVVEARISLQSEKIRAYRHTKTDASGSYIFHGLQPGHWELILNMPEGYAYGPGSLQEQRFILTGGAEVEHNFSIQQGVSLLGRVVDARGVGVAGAEIRTENRYDYSCYISDARTGPGGRFRIPGAPPNTTTELYAFTREQRSYVQRVEMGPLGSEPLEIVIEMPDCARITGSVSMAGVSLIERLQYRHQLRLKSADERIPSRIESSADMAGAFNLRGIPPGEYELFLKALGGHAECLVTTLRLEPGQQVDLGRIGCADLGGLALGGRVFSPEGRPIHAAQVCLKGLLDREMWTSVDGRFRFAGLEPGLYTVTATHRDYSGRNLESDAGAEDLSIALESAGSIAGKIRAARTGKPITQGTIRSEWWYARVMCSYASEPRRTTTDDVGAFLLDKMPAGSGKVFVEAPGYVQFTQEVSLDPGERIEGLEIALMQAMRLEGVVYSPGGAPVDDAEVQLYLLDAERASKTRTDEAGAFVFTDADPDGGFIQVRSKGFAPHTHELTPAELHSGKVVITLDHGGIIEGRIRVGDQPQSGRIHAWPKFQRGRPESSSASQDVGEDGDFRLESLAPGEYRVRASVDIADKTTSRMGRSVERQVFVEAGSVTMVDFQFEAATAVVEGMVHLIGLAATDLRVALRTVGEGQEEELDADARGGMFRFPAVPAGPVMLTASCSTSDGQYRGAEFLEVVAGGEYHVELTLQRQETVTIAASPLVDGEHFSAYFVPEAVAGFLPNPITPEIWESDYQRISRLIAFCVSFGDDDETTVDHVPPGDYQIVVRYAVLDDAWNAISESIGQQRVTVTGQPGQVITLERPE